MDSGLSGLNIPTVQQLAEVVRKSEYVSAPILHLVMEDKNVKEIRRTFVTAIKTHALVGYHMISINRS